MFFDPAIGRSLLYFEPSDADLISSYPLNLVDVVVFATDVFGNLFVKSASRVLHVDTETGDVTMEWESMEAWKQEAYDDPRGVVGQGALEDWERRLNGKLSEGHRLTPSIPFCFQNKPKFKNLKSVCINDLLGFRAFLTRKLEGVESGAIVHFDEVLDIQEDYNGMDLDVWKLAVTDDVEQRFGAVPSGLKPMGMAGW